MTTTHGLTKASLEGIHDSLQATFPGQVVTVSYDGNTASGIKASVATDPDLEEYGHLSSYKFSVRIQADDLPGVDVQKLVAISGTDYLVLDTTLDHTGAMLRLHLGDEHA